MNAQVWASSMFNADFSNLKAENANFAYVHHLPKWIEKGQNKEVKTGK